jgi:hypothetical protein
MGVLCLVAWCVAMRFLSEVQRPGLEAKQSSSLLAYSMEQSLSLVINRLTGQEIFRILWNSRFCLPLFPTLIQINPLPEDPSQ